MARTRFVAKALLLDRNGDFLLLKRSDTHPTLAGFYDLPGGTIEDTVEEPGAAVIREIKEETGLDVLKTSTHVLYAVTKLLTGKSFPTLLYVSHVNKVKPDVTLSWEHQAYEWTDLSRLSEVEPQLAPTYREALDYIRENNILEDIATD